MHWAQMNAVAAFIVEKKIDKKFTTGLFALLSKILCESIFPLSLPSEQSQVTYQFIKNKFT